MDFMLATEAYNHFSTSLSNYSFKLQSEYYVPDHFNQLSPKNKPSFSVLDLNIRRMKQNLHKLTDIDFSVIGLIN